MMQSQKLLGLSIYLPWLQAQMPLDTVSDETNKAINLRHQPKASEMKATSREFYIFFMYINSPAKQRSPQTPANARHLWKNEELAPVFKFSPGIFPPLGQAPS